MRQVNLQKLKALREAKDLTQEDVARYLGYKSALGYHYIESGRCRLRADHAIALASLYAVDVQELFFDQSVANAAIERTGTE